MNPFFQDQLDDPLLSAGTVSFFAWNPSLKASLLNDDRIQEAYNVRMDVDGLCTQRPGLRFVSGVDVAGRSSFPIAGITYFDVQNLEKVIVARGGTLFEIVEEDADMEANEIFGVSHNLDSEVRFTQLVDNLFFADKRVGLTWMSWPGGSLTYGHVTLDAHGTELPEFTNCLTHGYRLFAHAENTDEVWVSKYLDAKTDNVSFDEVTQVFRVGEGDGDPIVAMVSFQQNQLVFFKESSIYSVATAEQVVSNFTIQRLTGLAGCVASKTAVQLGQDVLFLSRVGVMSLGALVLSNSVSAATSVSGNIRRVMERINWNFVKNSWAVAWRQYYLLAIPLDDAQGPSTILAFNTETKEWVGEWGADLPNVLNDLTDAPIISYNVGATVNEFTDEIISDYKGWTCGVATRFSGKQETLLCDNIGRIYQLDEGQEIDTFGKNAYSQTPIVVSVKTKAWDMQLPDSLKQLFRLEFEGFRQTTPQLKCYIQRDGLEEQFVATYAFDGQMNKLPFTLPLTLARTEIQKKSTHQRSARLGRWRELSIRLQTVGRGRFSMRGIRLDAFADSGQIIY